MLWRLKQSVVEAVLAMSEGQQGIDDVWSSMKGVEEVSAY